MSYADLTVGQTAQITRVVSDADVHSFAQLTGDTNPVHLNDAVAAKTRFKTRIAHGMISAGHISAVLATKLPGAGTIYLSQTLKFTAPVKIGDAVTTTVKVLELMSKQRVRLETTCRNQAGETVLEGEAVVLVDDAK